MPPFIAPLSADVEIDSLLSRLLLLATAGAVVGWLVRARRAGTRHLRAVSWEARIPDHGTEFRVIARCGDAIVVEGPGGRFTYRHVSTRHRCGRRSLLEPGDVLHVLAETTNRDISVNLATCACIHLLWHLDEAHAAGAGEPEASARSTFGQAPTGHAAAPLGAPSHHGDVRKGDA